MFEQQQRVGNAPRAPVFDERLLQVEGVGVRDQAEAADDQLTHAATIAMTRWRDGAMTITENLHLRAFVPSRHRDCHAHTHAASNFSSVSFTSDRN